MTASSPPSSAAERLTRRAGGAVLALLVQALFIAALLLWAVRPLSRVREQKEFIFHLVPSARQAPPVRIIGGVPARKPVVPVPAPSPAAPSGAAPPSGIAGLGQSLFGCAPENYANLTPDARAHCTKPGEGLAYNRLPDLMGTPSHVKDEAHWEAEFARKTSPTMICPALSPGCLAMIILSGRITDPRTWPRYEVKQYAREDFYKIEQAYDAWHRQHATPPADCVPETPLGANRDKAAASGLPCPALPSGRASATNPARPGSP